jgi:hypothetical protein
LAGALRDLPYLVHTNRELGLMLRGTKPLAHFCYAVGSEPACLIRYLRLFDRRAAAGQFYKREVLGPAHNLLNVSVRRVFYALPGQEWRIDTLLELLRQPGAWNEERERREGELLGYEGWQNDVWLDLRRARTAR